MKKKAVVFCLYNFSNSIAQQKISVFKKRTRGGGTIFSPMLGVSRVIRQISTHIERETRSTRLFPPRDRILRISNEWREESVWQLTLARAPLMQLDIRAAMIARDEKFVPARPVLLFGCNRLVVQANDVGSM